MNCPLRVKQIILTDNEFEASSGGINDEIIAATNVNSALFPKYYRRAVGFTGKLTARFVYKKLYFLTRTLYCKGTRVTEPKKWLVPNFIFKGWE